MLQHRSFLRYTRILKDNLWSRTFSRTSRRCAEEVRIVEVGPRDGLQNEKLSIPLKTKIELIERLAKTGVTYIEGGSFVSSSWVPQMANSAEVLSHITSKTPPSPSSVTYNFLVPNLKGLDGYFKAKEASEPSTIVSRPLSPASTSTETDISIFTAATESFSKANTNCTVAESLERCKAIISSAKSRDVRVRGYVSVALGCPYEGPKVPPAKVAEIAASLLEMGVDEVSVADTTGMGTAPRTRELLTALFSSGISNKDLALHLHDTYGQALVNAMVGLEYGIRRFDCSVGGLGGCPFSKGATGNVPTEDLVHCLHGLGIKTGVNLEKMAEIGGWISAELGVTHNSRAGKALLAKMGLN